MAEQVEPATKLSHDQKQNAYAEKWRAMANEYYAKHPLPDDSSSHNESSPSPVPASSVQLASHQQSASQHEASHHSATDQPAVCEVLPSSTLQELDTKVLRTHAAVTAITDLGIGGLLAGLSAAGLASIFFHTAWPVADRAKGSSSTHPIYQPSIRVNPTGDTTDERELRIELPSDWVQTPRTLSATLRTAIITASYLAIVGAILGMSLA